jgi:pilus assembly protein Flp/PilA
MGNAFIRLLRDETGATSIEYAMIAAGIAVAIVVAVVSLGSELTNSYTSVDTAMK